jgi:hypothetical protein
MNTEDLKMAKDSRNSLLNRYERPFAHENYRKNKSSKSGRNEKKLLYLIPVKKDDIIQTSDAIFFIQDIFSFLSFSSFSHF